MSINALIYYKTIKSIIDKKILQGVDMPEGIREEAIKWKAGSTFFDNFNCTVIENIDFAVTDNESIQHSLFTDMESEYYLYN